MNISILAIIDGRHPYQEGSEVFLMKKWSPTFD
ncbi:unnamed protein product [Nezara viridula]|uniref:Uncharacterized protein n=1 Tax=Nezara viridula TaxID=85310 RepID=A0A9P0MU32_NEZVI|nr:unnamed protein product [Nezara viridula]